MERHRCGLYARNGERDGCPLVSASCNVSVVDVNVHAKLLQTYVSTMHEPQDVTYVFPLPADAAVCAFSAVIDEDRTIHGVVKERQQAKRDYERAVSAGKTAALLQQHTTQVFEVALGNLKPNQTVVVQIEFVSVIAHTGTTDSLRLKLPVTVAPFYGQPPETLKGLSTSPPDRIFELNASFKMAANITSITSTSHPVSVNLGSSSPVQHSASYDSTTAHVSLVSNTALNDDIILEMTCAGLDAPRCTVQRLASSDGDAGEVTDALSLTLVPRFPVVPVTQQEYIFLVDRSGSMSGQRIAAVRNALQIMLRSLPSKHTTFNIFSFGNSCSSLWPRSVEYTRDSVTEASAHVDKMGADFGGTEVAGALQHVFKSRQDRQKTSAAVFMLTDGEAWDLKNVFKVVSDAVAASENALRLFVLGVGNQVSSEMCDGIARAGRGVATYVTGSEKPDVKLVALLKAARSALVQDVVVDWGVPVDLADDFEVVEVPDDLPATKPALMSLFADNLEDTSDVALGPGSEPIVLPPPSRLQQAPMRLDSLPPLYAGFRCSIYALIRRPRDSPLPQRISLRGRLLDTQAVLDVPVIDASASTPFIQVLAARALVQDLEDISAAGGTSESISALTKAKIARLGTTYGIATSQTSFIAIDDAGEAIPTADKSASSSSFGRNRRVKRSARLLAIANPTHSGSDSDSDADNLEASHINVQVDKLSSDAESVSAQEESDEDMGFSFFDGYDYDVVEPAKQRRALLAVEPDDDARRTLMQARAMQLAGHAQAMRLEGRAPSRPSPPREPVSVSSIAREQQFDGAFPDTDAFVLDTLRLAELPVPPSTLAHAELKTVWHSVLAVAYLKKHFTTGEEPEAWAFLADKAREFALDMIAAVNVVSDGEAGTVFDEAIMYALNLV